MTVQYFIGDCLDSLRKLDSESVHFAMTSPPYWALRNYANLAEQHGLEKTPAAFITKQMEVFDEVRRVMRADGALVVNIGDSYSAGSTHKGLGKCGQKCGRDTDGQVLRGENDLGLDDQLPQKTLVGIPERFMLAMIDRGWILRNKVVWRKKNCMPSSAADRLKCSWEPCYVFVKSGRYYSDVDAVRISSATPPHPTGSGGKSEGVEHGPMDRGGSGWKNGEYTFGAGGQANPGDVLELTTQPSKIPHYAMYPVRLPLFFMRWLMPRRVCGKCGKAWRRETQASGGTIGQSWHDHESDLGAGMTQVKHSGGVGNAKDSNGEAYTRKTLGWRPACECNADATGPTILDPYGGPGTTAAAAEYLWTHPAEGLDTVLADARTVATRPNAGATSKFHDGDGSQRPECAKKRLCKTGTPATVFQPFLPGRAIMLDLDPRCEQFHAQRRDECFNSLTGESAETPKETTLFALAP